MAFMSLCPISAQLVGFHRHGHRFWTKDGGRRGGAELQLAALITLPLVDATLRKCG